MNAKDEKIVIEKIKESLPELSDVISGTDDVTGDSYFVGTDTEGRKCKFIVKVKITQISKKPEVKKE